MKVKKVINNNIIAGVDKNGYEVLCTGRGIGYKKRVGENIDDSTIEKIYRMEGKQDVKRLRELVAQIPLEHLELTEKFISEIKTQLNHPLNESLLITLADHISFAIRRKHEGIEFTNPLKPIICYYYEAEYRLGQHFLDLIRNSFGISLHPDEAAFIALHIVNAELNTNIGDMVEITKMIDGCVQEVESYFGRRLDRNSLDFSRFVIHLRYFAQRLFSTELEYKEENPDLEFLTSIARTCKEEYQCAIRLASYIYNTYQKEATDEEIVYLTIHLKRIHFSDH